MSRRGARRGVPAPSARRPARTQWVALLALVALVAAVGAWVAAASRGAGGVDGAAAPPRIEALPVPSLTTAPSPSAAGLCGDAAFTAALASRDDPAAVAAAGGGEAFRAAVASGAAPCVALDDPQRIWTVVDKLRPYGQIDYEPAPLEVPAGVRNIPGGALRPAAAAAVTDLVHAAADAGVGEIGIDSAYRSYRTQQSTYAGHVASKGQAGADAVSARPGYSEHQSGLAVDLMACDGRGCSAIEGFGPTEQGRWVAEHAWEHGFIVRYEEGYTPVTGYSPEPWHLRYIGDDLARAYHEGGWHTLEDFFGLPPAPDYAP